MADLNSYRRGGAAPAESSTAPDLAPILAGGAGLALLGLAAKNPGLLGKAASKLGALRQQLMLSGLAAPKSLLGNIGGTAIASAERGTLEPLRQLFSRQTLDDLIQAYRQAPGATHPVYGPTLPGPTPGRIMGAIDTAAQNALVRSGVMHDPAEVAKAVARGIPRSQAIQQSAEKAAAREMLQAPLQGQLASALDSPIARYLVPFRRTPFNQFIEGFETLKPANLAKHPVLTGGIAGAGAVHGAATADERYPVSLGLGSAAASRYGLPYILGAVAGRTLAGAPSNAGIAGAALPVSEYGITSSVEAPLRPFQEPALLKLLSPYRR